ncbi:ABC transporter permease [Rhodococcoides kyotonense]|uniref:ABC transporter permease n=1 Tax=Rhodococcoides kyotonense TaxID=398843 RepID=A0A239J471_9NOCA|nr:ABC transporter permease [Rhodococcus kyotonensis]SNT00053.1 hypothetical protein SAMN05421642_10819 [Rhodococcus kyotonensis]
MVVVRTVWLLLAVAGVASAVMAADSPMMTVSLSCSKIGELSAEGATCDDRIIDVLGVQPLLILGASLAAPPLVAALAMRRWVSWLAVVALLALAFIGLANWTGFWRELLVALPMALVGLALVYFQRVRTHVS